MDLHGRTLAYKLNVLGTKKDQTLHQTNKDIRFPKRSVIGWCQMSF